MSPKMNWGQIISGVVIGAIGAGVSMFFLLSQKITKLEMQVEVLNEKTKVSSLPVPYSVQKNANPRLLLDYIKSEQKKEVRESYGEYANQNFSKDDLDLFIKNGTPQHVKERLKHDGSFIDVVMAIKNMDPTSRQELFKEGLQTYKKTWAQLGKITSEGQTDAGQTAEKMIAESILALTKELNNMSVEELNGLRK